MQLVILQRRDGAEELSHDIGATVVRSAPAGGGIVLEMGPADGAPHLRLTLTTEETNRLVAAFRSVTTNGREEIVFPDDR